MRRTRGRETKAHCVHGAEVLPAIRWSTLGCAACARLARRTISRLHADEWLISPTPPSHDRYATGWMHQSVRMICASFLVEFLGHSWVDGARWFHETLVDADLAINSMMWQNAGRSGIDQWNFVMSPENGSQDPTGAYVRQWVPELARLPNKHLHTPWRAPAAVLEQAGVVLGETYPHRVVSDLDSAREQTVARLIATRASALDFNDAGGYDLITLPSGHRTRVFTKQEFRLSADGTSKPPPPSKNPGGGSGGGGGRARGGRNAAGAAAGRGQRGGRGSTVGAEPERIDASDIRRFFGPR